MKTLTGVALALLVVSLPVDSSHGQLLPVPNAGFEEGLLQTDWCLGGWWQHPGSNAPRIYDSVSGDPMRVHSGRFSLQLTFNSEEASQVLPIPVVQGDSLVLGVWVRMPIRGSLATKILTLDIAGVDDGDSSPWDASSFPQYVGPFTEWTRLQVACVVPVSVPRIAFDINTGNGSGCWPICGEKIWVDDVSLSISRSTQAAVWAADVIYPQTTAGDSLTQAWSVKIFRGSSIGLRIRRSAESPFHFSSAFEESLATGLTVSAPDSFRTLISFAPAHAGVFDDVLYVEDASSGDTLAMGYLRGTGRALSFTTDVDPLREIEEGNQASVTVVTDYGVKADSMIVFCSPGGSRSFSPCLKMDLFRDEPDNQWYRTRVPVTGGVGRGLQFYVTAFNGPVTSSYPDPSEPVCLRVWLRNITCPRSQQASVYQMISFPLYQRMNTVGGVLEDDLGVQDRTRWRMYQYAPSESIYTELLSSDAPSLRQGEAYWLITREAALLDTGPVPGLTTPTDSAFVLVLKPGWNMIGDPFGFPVAWDSLRVGDIPVSEQEDVQGAYQWNPTIHGYEDSVRVLLPFEGYWVRNAAADSVVLRIPAIEADTVFVRRERRGALAVNEERGWRLRVGATSCGVEDRCNYVRLVEGASPGQDRFDRHEPPPAPGRSLSLRFFSDGPRGRFGPLAVDARGAKEDTDAPSQGGRNGPEVHAWSFDVVKSFADQGSADVVELAFSGARSIPLGTDLVLVDRELNMVVKVEEGTRYEFHLGTSLGVRSASVCRFVLLAGNGGSVGERASALAGSSVEPLLYQNHPNPAVAGTVIRYDLATGSNVRLRIFDVRGSLVKILDQGYREPGGHEVPWLGQDERGRWVAGGTYFYRLETEEYDASRKLQLIR
jgi:hypothetical protein